MQHILVPFDVVVSIVGCDIFEIEVAITRWSLGFASSISAEIKWPFDSRCLETYQREH